VGVERDDDRDGTEERTLCRQALECGGESPLFDSSNLWNGSDNAKLGDEEARQAVQGMRTYATLLVFDGGLESGVMTQTLPTMPAEDRSTRSAGWARRALVAFVVALTGE
jgi:hypothetical protein